MVNPAVVGLPTRYIWANVLVSEPSPLSSNALMKYDVAERSWLIHTLEGDRRASECYFVPRGSGGGGGGEPGGGAAADEDDGYLLCFAAVAGTQESDLYIVDAGTMERVAIVSLGGAFVPGGFHALWVDAAKYGSPGSQRFDTLEPERAGLPRIGELDWTGGHANL